MLACPDEGNATWPSYVKRLKVASEHSPLAVPPPPPLPLHSFLTPSLSLCPYACLVHTLSPDPFCPSLPLISLPPPPTNYCPSPAFTFTLIISTPHNYIYPFLTPSQVHVLLHTSTNPSWYGCTCVYSCYLYLLLPCLEFLSPHNYPSSMHSCITCPVRITTIL